MIRYNHPGSFGYYHIGIRSRTDRYHLCLRLGRSKPSVFVLAIAASGAMSALMAGTQASDSSNVGKGGATSIMRVSINHGDAHSDVKARTLARRVVFKWLPVYCENDMVHGAWWFVWGSLLTIWIPIMPLIALYEDWWPDAATDDGKSIMPLADHVAAYGMLAFAGVLYTIGSYIFVRVFRDNPPPPIFNFKHRLFCNDELIASWLFLIGTLPFIPIMGLYVHYNPDNGAFMLAFLLCILANLAFFIFIIVTAPASIDHHEHVHIISFISPVIRKVMCLRETSIWHKHLANDWLLTCWLMVWGCALAVFASILLLIYEGSEHSKRGIFDWSTGAFDCLLFMIGSMYWTAGSYAEKQQSLASQP